MVPSKKKKKGETRKSDRFLYIKTLSHVTNLIACLVWMIGGIKVGARTGTIVYHCMMTVVVVGFVSWVVTRVMASYEEINSGKA